MTSGTGALAVAMILVQQAVAGPLPRVLLELDAGGRRNPDGRGFAAFARVVEGMAVVRRIHGSPASGQDLTPPIRIVRARRLQGGP